MKQVIITLTDDKYRVKVDELCYLDALSCLEAMANAVYAIADINDLCEQETIAEINFSVQTGITKAQKRLPKSYEEIVNIEGCIYD